MASRFRHAVIVGKTQASGNRELLEAIGHFVADEGLDVSFERGTAAASGVTGFDTVEVSALGGGGRGGVDLVIVVGGDGTMLGIAREVARHDLPLVGINQGRLGFITDVSPDRWREALAPMLGGDYAVEQRSMLEGEVWRDGERVYAALSLNDVVVNRSAMSGMVELRVDVGDDFVANLRADGLIVASPTGSTAYALSAGGPILHPAIAGWVMVPIASHTLSNRPIVLPDADVVRIGIVAGKDVSANFDMHNLASLTRGDEVRVRRSAHRVRFLHPKGWSYYATLRRKLRWYEGVV